MIAAVLDKLYSHAFSFETTVVLLTWVSAVLGAAITFASRRGDGGPFTLRGFLGFLVPPPIWRHRSPRMDVLYYAVQHAMLPLLAVPFMLSNVVVADLVYGWLTKAFGAHGATETTLGIWVLLLVITLIVTDFASWLQHFLFHKIGPFWEFHKVHHSVEFLTPLSNRRIHPFDEVADIFGQAICIGVTTGALSYALSLPLYDSSILGLDVYFVGNLLSFYHLRHSHVDMAYGRRIEKVLMSPAQHQLHHSSEKHHWDVNFGQLLSVWDTLFGTLMHSERYGTFRLGLPGEQGRDFETVWWLYLSPLRNNWRRLRRALRPQVPPNEKLPEADGTLQAGDD